MKNNKYFKLKIFVFLSLFFFLLFSSTVITKTKAPNNTPYYIKNTMAVKKLYVISQDKINTYERTMIATLQGLISNKSSSQIYTLSSTEPDYEIWLKDLNNNYGVAYEFIDDPFELINIFKKYISGYVLYNKKSPMDPSINNACSLASLKESIAIDESLETKIKSYGIKTLVGDCRNTNKFWAYDNLWNSGLNHSTVIQLSPDKDTSLRDYGIMTKSLVFYEEDIHDKSLRDKVFSSMEKDSIALGWGPDEHENVTIASNHGVSVIAADWSYNLTVLSSFPSTPLTQKSNTELSIEKDVHYVTFIMSDGDNQQWNLGSNYGSNKWYGSPYRGNFNMGWSMSPSLYYLAPTVFNMYYKSANTGKANDYFIVAPSGNGYMYPSKFPKDDLLLNVDKLNNYMKNVDEKYVAILDDDSLDNLSLWDNYTSKSNIQGLFYLNYSKNNSYNGKIVWSNNKPIVSSRDLLWSGLEDEGTLVKNINDRVNSGETNINSPNAYTFVYVHAWSKDMTVVENVVSKLKENPKVRVVTPDTFMTLIKRNLSK
ncbi:GxGYxYP domain-containing protein [Clostridium hydrogeniformans]|uniref:GxGYxYP domain-containing protein n=1 Tax=Clostridium hydrogeniformans TaxID=349933 RepID=UPI000481DE3C|nr:GxGYxYP domain-containing protein [Clostridium hydrogeniformans]